jgi:hypothetical protein
MKTDELARYTDDDLAIAIKLTQELIALVSPATYTAQFVVLSGMLSSLYEEAARRQMSRTIQLAAIFIELDQHGDEHRRLVSKDPIHPGAELWLMDRPVGKRH